MDKQQEKRRRAKAWRGGRAKHYNNELGCPTCGGHNMEQRILYGENQIYYLHCWLCREDFDPATGLSV